MKKVIITIALTLFISLFSFAQMRNFEYSDNWGKAGFNLIKSDNSNVEIVFSIKNFNISNQMINGEELDNINLSGNFLFNEAGKPNLPAISKLIAIPEGSKAVLTVKEFKTEKYQNIDMAPAPIIPLETDTEIIYNKDSKVFNTDAFYPQKPFILSQTKEIRGVDAVMLSITPFQYNPVTKELIVYKDIKLDVSFSSNKGLFGENELRSRFWDPLLNEALINYSSLPKIDYSFANKNSKTSVVYDYIILTLDDPIFINKANELAEFRRKQGIATGVFTISDVPGGNDVDAIKTWIQNLSPLPDAVLILADYATDASGITSKTYPHPYTGTYITDNYYADTDGDDLPDIVLARMTATNATQLNTMVSKVINYESNPPTSSDFYKSPITALGWQTSRWFQICSESVRGFWENELGKSPVAINNINSGTPGAVWSTASNTATVVEYFGPSGVGYIPNHPSDLGGSAYWDSGSASAVNQAIEQGAFMLQHRDHGGVTGWGEPSYHSSDIDNLTNKDLPFVWSINCLTGKFNSSSECFAEKFHRHTTSSGSNSGALGIIAATQISYSFVNDTYTWGAYDNMWPNFLPDENTTFDNHFIYPAFASAAGKYFLSQSSWPYNTGSKQITYRLFHHHGDAFLNVYSEVPQNLPVIANTVHVLGDSNYEVSVMSGATIALTYYDDVDEETKIIDTAISGAGTTILDLSSCPPAGTEMLLTITKQNYFRYTQTVTVLGCSSTISLLTIYNEGFENTFGDWTQNTTDDFDWSLRTGPTPSSGTGPSAAAEGNYYAYMESSYPNYPAKNAILDGPCFDLRYMEHAKLAFRYHMYGNSDMGKLSLRISTDNGATWSIIWAKIGNQGNEWKTAYVDLGSYVGGIIKLRFRGKTGTTWQGDMAIDGFSMKGISLCTSVVSSFPYSQSFESTDPNDWVQETSDDFDWTYHSGSTPSVGTGPSGASGGTQYAYMESSYPNYPNKNAILNSPCFDLADVSFSSLKFKYHMYGSTSMGKLSLQISTDFGTTWTSVWSKEGNQGNEWKIAYVNLGSYLGEIIKLRFNGKTGTTWQGDMAIDQFKISGISSSAKSETETDIVMTSKDEETDINMGIQDIIVYPNPVDNILSVQFTEDELHSYYITDMVGNVIISDELSNNKIDVSRLKSGVYLIIFNNNNRMISTKFIKK